MTADRFGVLRRRPEGDGVEVCTYWRCWMQSIRCQLGGIVEARRLVV